MGLVNINDKDGNELNLDDYTLGIPTLSDDESMINKSLGYTASYALDIASLASHYGILTTPNTTDYIHLIFEIETEQETHLVIYENITASSSLSGTALTIYNNDRNSANTSSGLAYYSPTVTDVTLGSTTILTRHWTGTDTKRTRKLILDANKKYAFTIRNDSTANASYTSYSYQWFEK
jgi:hypothetical protein